MNTLFIIGNGFDLAHGLKTRYEDFILSLIKKDLLELISIFKEIPQTNFDLKSTNITLSSSPDLVISFLEKFTPTIESISDLKRNVGQFKHITHLRFKNLVLQRIWKSHKSPNWSDIEWQYFQTLVGIVNPPKSSPLTDQTIHLENQLIKLNEDIDEIAQELNDYLKEISENFIPDLSLIEKYNKILLEHLGGNNLILNFNYTSVLSHCPTANQFDMINIHGILGQYSPLIIGYGDEATSLYKKLENQNNFEFLRHTKSSRYAENDNYHKVHSFINRWTKPISMIEQENINSGITMSPNYVPLSEVPYEVVILGHSCGLSDRVLLKEILENNNCEKVHVYYYNDKKGNTDFLHTVSNISRHFDNKVHMRSKVQSLKLKYRMPQWDDEPESKNATST
ncbi:MAG: hypothetical protein COA58_05490 [Bacteroidetes bacterium]|nr:MAG: hypothetical protein COA58_05490 [Bacteroidota bacterium]